MLENVVMWVWMQEEAWKWRAAVEKSADGDVFSILPDCE
ncbi:hypothetical protein PF005_g26903 [Phytophthora fragariae]|uniref:Uncharacterized protein n=2 Tax=Phytophthora TaxID=4783 RepID=A0A6A3Q7Q0_9STRA|nr:hypothetical protein PF003_g18312 [Phytophthora fragariae]KAE8976904.1 hypothetical protein PR002_g25178 [Phytophthora rubi]KAE8922193.1 hypothetical protein PF009_g27542 [Phytophthora fragariae]KAE8971967.1 hypothetical protein PF011_g25831 [Phytophthora fragariae]KAE8980306.1 hypothetical protein PR001_g24311 [Phytophthora rubi]